MQIAEKARCIHTCYTCNAFTGENWDWKFTNSGAYLVFYFHSSTMYTCVVLRLVTVRIFNLYTNSIFLLKKKNCSDILLKCRNINFHESCIWRKNFHENWKRKSHPLNIFVVTTCIMPSLFKLFLKVVVQKWF